MQLNIKTTILSITFIFANNRPDLGQRMNSSIDLAIDRSTHCWPIIQCLWIVYILINFNCIKNQHEFVTKLIHLVYIYFFLIKKNARSCVLLARDRWKFSALAITNDPRWLSAIHNTHLRIITLLAFRQEASKARLYRQTGRSMLRTSRWDCECHHALRWIPTLRKFALKFSLCFNTYKGSHESYIYFFYWLTRTSMDCSTCCLIWVICGNRCIQRV